MNRPYAVIGSIVIILILVAVGAYAYSRTHHSPSDAVISTASYLCRGGKTIEASYATDSVTLTLSDTRAMVLPQVMSGSGIRYEKDGVVFASKGDNAFLTENGTETYSDCVANSSPAATGQGGMKQFSDSGGTFTFMYPDTVTVSGGGVGYSTSWMNNATSSGLVLAKALLSNSIAPSTNFSDATLTVGTSADPSAVSSCLTFNPTGGPVQPATKKTINGTTFTMLQSADAGAGNRYNTTSYRVVRNNQCYVIEYTIHSTAIQNYDPSQGITEFDAAKVTGIMEGIVNSFQFTDGA
jgi:membrane-bound inhibitor of C-type lysozyme